MDAIPGYTNKTWFKAERAGTFRGQCAELCGRNHANMLARVRAVPFDEYQAWYDQQAADITAARDEGAKQREELSKQQTRSRRAVGDPRREDCPSTPWPSPPSPPPPRRPRVRARPRPQILAHEIAAPEPTRLAVVDHHDRSQEDRDPLPLHDARLLPAWAASRRCCCGSSSARRTTRSSRRRSTTRSSPCTGRR